MFTFQLGGKTEWRAVFPLSGAYAGTVTKEVVGAFGGGTVQDRG